MPQFTRSSVKVADEVWIATALLHQEHPDRADFTVSEIVDRGRREAAEGELRPSFHVHVIQHCVANRAPNPARYRMLTETRRGCRRLYRPGDRFHPARNGGKVMPDANEIPEKYLPLLQWHRSVYAGTVEPRPDEDSLLALRGTGRSLWADEHADEYVRRLREGWE